MAKVLINSLTVIRNSDCYAHFSLEVIKVKWWNPCKCFVISKTEVSESEKMSSWERWEKEVLFLCKKMSSCWLAIFRELSNWNRKYQLSILTFLCSETSWATPSAVLHDVLFYHVSFCNKSFPISFAFSWISVILFL